MTSTPRIKINKKARFCAGVPTCPVPSISFVDIITSLDVSEKAANPKVTDNALNNAHGDWYEWLIAIPAWNWNVAHPNSYWLVRIPNVTSFDVSSLYIPSLHELINDLRAKVFASAGVNLISSNPDFAIIDHSHITLSTGYPSRPITTVDEASINQIETLRDALVGLCDFDSVVGYLSVKSSLRPDRRLQLLHEGSLMKALYAHLQTRQWLLDPPGLKYYGCTSKANPKDLDALQTVATHSITTVFSKPQKAVDHVFQVDSIQAAEQMFAMILGQ